MTIKLRDRLRKWWSPAQWAEDHPLDASERLAQKQRPGHWYNQDVSDLRVNVERPFKKPR